MVQSTRRGSWADLKSDHDDFVHGAPALSEVYCDISVGWSCELPSVSF